MQSDTSRLQGSKRFVYYFLLPVFFNHIFLPEYSIPYSSEAFNSLSLEKCLIFKRNSLNGDIVYIYIYIYILVPAFNLNTSRKLLSREW